MATQVSPAALHSMLKERNVFLVDVREPFEYRREHIAGSHSFPKSSLQPDEVLQAAGRLPICVQCVSGDRSSIVAQSLAGVVAKSHSAYRNVGLYNLTGGITAWRTAGLPVVEDKKAPLPVIRQVHLIASTLILSGTLLTRFYNQNFFALPLFVGCGLFVSGATGFCGMAVLLQYLPYNKAE
ncbi:rhodanese domain protein [Strigomonas culicis]|uniref:Rhodanese domain protein n=1 Tax=Strigomonas culicis TaxID=28005 RepID=S9TBG6_9TRYP|nr:rhodanese domain protein [Strigomonas culicis]|eukprot:EPY15357.1 rhodanese domain protein [Strigomonas culicis]